MKFRPVVFAKTQQRPECHACNRTCYTTSLYLIDFKCALNFGEGQLNLVKNCAPAKGRDDSRKSLVRKFHDGRDSIAFRFTLRPPLRGFHGLRFRKFAHLAHHVPRLTFPGSAYQICPRAHCHRSGVILLT
jgi:hypothetical protein